MLPSSAPAPTSTQLGLSLALVSASTPTRPPTHPTTEKAGKEHHHKISEKQRSNVSVL